MTREYTNKILEAVEEGILDKDQVILAALNALSEDEVEQMAKANEFFPYNDDEEEFDDDDADYDYDGQPDEAQEWADYDPDC